MSLKARSIGGWEHKGKLACSILEIKKNYGWGKAMKKERRKESEGIAKHRQVWPQDFQISQSIASQPRHRERMTLLGRAVLCLAASLVSTHLEDSSTYKNQKCCNNQKRLWLLPNVLWGAKSPSVENPPFPNALNLKWSLPDMQMFYMSCFSWDMQGGGKFHNWGQCESQSRGQGSSRRRKSPKWPPFPLLPNPRNSYSLQWVLCAYPECEKGREVN